MLYAKINYLIPVLFTDKTFNMALSVANTGRKKTLERN